MFPYHCNKCFRLKELELTTLELYMAKCGHILCKDCAKTACAICSQPFTPRTLVTDARGTSVAPYFGNALHLYQNFQKILKFQMTQQANLMTYFVKVMPGERLAVRAQRKGFEKLDARLSASEEHEQARIIKLKEYLKYVENHPSASSKKSSRGTRFDSGLSDTYSLNEPSIVAPNTPTLSSLSNKTANSSTIKRSQTSKQRHHYPYKSNFQL